MTFGNTYYVSFRKKLVYLGDKHGDKYPWHLTKSPYKIFLAEYLLTRTTRVVVSKVYPKLIETYPTLKELSAANERDLMQYGDIAGLKKRFKALRGIAKKISKEGGIRADREKLLGIPFVGPYISDAVLLYAFGEKVFPLDRNIQRVLYRSIKGENPQRKSDPYKDQLLDVFVRSLIGRIHSSKVRKIHQALLYIAWTFCKANPICILCKISKSCSYGKKGLGI